MKNKIAALMLLAVSTVTVLADDKHVTVTFDSDPPGQRVFVGYTASLDNDYAKEYLGKTPCTNSVVCGSGDTVLVKSKVSMTGWRVPLMVFTCEPPHGATNLFEQKLVLHGDAHLRDPDVIPHAMFFDMYKLPKVEK